MGFDFKNWSNMVKERDAEIKKLVESYECITNQMKELLDAHFIAWKSSGSKVELGAYIALCEAIEVIEEAFESDEKECK